MAGLKSFWRSNHQIRTVKTNRDHSLDARAEPRRGLCQGSATATRRTLSGLDTDRYSLGFLSPTIREWQHEMKLRAPRRHVSIQRRATSETAICVWGNVLP